MRRSIYVSIRHYTRLVSAQTGYTLVVDDIEGQSSLVAIPWKSTACDAQAFVSAFLKELGVSGKDTIVGPETMPMGRLRWVFNYNNIALEIHVTPRIIVAEKLEGRYCTEHFPKEGNWGLANIAGADTEVDCDVCATANLNSCACGNTPRYTRFTNGDNGVRCGCGEYVRGPNLDVRRLWNEHRRGYVPLI